MLLIAVATSDIWGFELGWDVMVDKMVLMARAMGIPTITCEQHFAELEGPRWLAFAEE